MNRTCRNTSGFTLVEILVAIAILGIVLAALFNFSRSTLRFSSTTSAVSDSVADLSDAEGYLTDAMRNAKVVLSAFTLLRPDSSTLATCDLDASGTCIGLVVPVVDTSQRSQPIVNFNLSAFFVQPIGATFDGLGIAQGWQGEDTLSLIEYRVENLCTSPCSSFVTALSPAQRTVSLDPGFVLGGLSDVDGGGDPVDVFQVIDDSSLLMTFVVRAQDGRSNPYVVSRSPVALQVSVRD